jgi:hypothetical protein
MADHAARALARPQELWAEARATLAAQGLIARCAWCERYRLRDEWVSAAEIGGPLDPITDTTHTICSLCDHRLRAAGLAR